MHKKLINLFLLSLPLIAGCGGGTSSSSSGSAQSTNSDYTGASLEGGAVSEMTFNSSNEGTVTFGSVTSSSEYVLAIYSYSSSGSTSAFEVSQNETSTKDLNTLNLKALTSAGSDVTEDFHEMLRNAEQDLDPSALIEEKPVNKALTKSAVIGSTREFKVLSSFSGGSSTASVTGVLVYETNNFKAYIDQRNQAALTSDDWDDLMAPYDAMIGTERSFFGQESDIDGDGKFNILFTQEVNELGGSAGGIITGFFYAVDLFSVDTYAQSNETEIFYTFVPDPSGSFGVTISKEFALSNILPSVLPHEFQHMINFNEHYMINNGSAESSFLNEGLSHLAEDIYSVDSNDYMTTTGIENPARVSGYLASTDNLCITCGASLYQRGGSYLMLRYLYEQAEKGNLSAVTSGKQLLNRLVNTSNTGVGNIAFAAYGTSDSDTAFTSLMGQFGLAMLMSDTGLTTDDRLQIDGIDLRSAQNDNRGTVLEGPSVITPDSVPLTTSVGGASISYVHLTGEEINDMGGTLHVQLASGANAGGYVIQIGL